MVAKGRAARRDPSVIYAGDSADDAFAAIDGIKVFMEVFGGPWIVNLYVLQLDDGYSRTIRRETFVSDSLPQLRDAEVCDLPETKTPASKSTAEDPDVSAAIFHFERRSNW